MTRIETTSIESVLQICLHPVGEGDARRKQFIIRVIREIRGRNCFFQVYQLEDALTDAISAAGAGEFDGNSFGSGECVLFMCGPDADKLLAAIQPVIDAHLPMLKGGHAILRYGPHEDGIREVSIPITAGSQTPHTHRPPPLQA